MIQALRARLTHFLSTIDDPRVRKLYWNLRAADIHAKWGQGSGDFPILDQILQPIVAHHHSHGLPVHVLDIGCGSGRLFPVYLGLSVDSVTGQDISPAALDLCARRFADPRILLQSVEILALEVPATPYALTVSNRVLSAVHPRDIAQTIAHLCRISERIYVNEVSESDRTPPSTYWFMHDYEALLAPHDFAQIDQGLWGTQTWRVYARRGQSLS